MELLETLKARAAMLAAVRAYFDSAGFTEVATPAALPHPNLDPNIRPLPVFVRDTSGRERRHWLHTSPEIAMKKLLARGSGSIYQVVPVFRDGETTSIHRPEFSMLEWYRVGAGYREAMADTVGVIRAACLAVNGRSTIRCGGRECDLDGPWDEMTMGEAFTRFTGVEGFSREELAAGLERAGEACPPEEPVEELFMRLYVAAVEPGLGGERPLIIRDFPAFLGTMAAPAAGNPDFLERFEVYIGGLELANGYTELLDADELQTRMEKVRATLAEDGVEGVSVDPEFLAAVRKMPPCAGVSVGLDRLLMLLLGRGDIAEVTYPFSGKSEAGRQETE